MTPAFAHQLATDRARLAEERERRAEREHARQHIRRMTIENPEVLDQIEREWPDEWRKL